jgi:hypothetical protein
VQRQLSLHLVEYVSSRLHEHFLEDEQFPVCLGNRDFADILEGLALKEILVEGLGRGNRRAAGEQVLLELD